MHGQQNIKFIYSYHHLASNPNNLNYAYVFIVILLVY
jgi:hypothetical protein